MPIDYQYAFDLRHLVHFREVALRLHFRRAAEALAIAQPALSRTVAQLEAAVGAKLLDRSRRTVRLTAAGATLLERSEPLLRGLAGLGSDVRAVAEGRVGELRVAFTGLAMATVLPAILREFHRRYPGIRLELNESPTAAQLAALERGDLACGFFHPDAPTPTLRTRLLLREANGVLLPVSHPLGARPALRLRDLAQTPFVLFPRSHNPGFYDRVLAACARAGFAPRIAEEVWPRQNAIGLVRSGLGVTFMTPSEAQHLPPDIVFRRLQGPAPESRLVLGWRSVAKEEPALAAFLAVAGLAPREEKTRRPEGATG